MGEIILNQCVEAHSYGFLIGKSVIRTAGKHVNGDFDAMVQLMKKHSIERPDWWDTAVSLEHRLNPDQVKSLPSAHLKYKEWRKVKDKITREKINCLPYVRAPGADGNNLRDPLKVGGAYAPAWDVLMLDFDGLPLTIKHRPTVDAIRIVLESLGYAAVIHTTPTHSKQIAKFRVMVRSVPLSMSPDGAGYEPTRGADARYRAHVLIEQALMGAWGAVCLKAKHNSADCVYALTDTGELLHVDRSVYKAAQPFFIPFKDADWWHIDGEPASLESLNAAAAVYGFADEVEENQLLLTKGKIQASVKEVTAKNLQGADVSNTDNIEFLGVHHITSESVTAQMVADLRTIMTDSRMKAQATNREAWIKVISALTGGVAQASDHAQELEEIAIKWGDSAAQYKGETAAKIERERHSFTRSNPASLFTFASSLGISNPASVRADKRRNDTAQLSGKHMRKLQLSEVAALEAINEKRAHVMAGGKSCIVEAVPRNLGGNLIHEIRYLRAEELIKMESALKGVYGYTEKQVEEKDETTGEKRTVLKQFAGNYLSPTQAWLAWPFHKIYLGGCDFYPNPVDCPEDVYNLYRGMNVAQEKGDVSPWVNLVTDVICAGDQVLAKYVIQYFAHMIQKPEQRPHVAIIMRGKPGAGKGSLLTPFRKMLGQHYAQVQGLSKISGKFNALVIAKLLVFIDEIRASGKETADAFKVMVTESVLAVEKKGIDAESVSNFARYIGASNRFDAVHAMENERRQLLLEVSDKYTDKNKGSTREYWKKYNDWCENGGAGKLLHFLAGYDISDFDHTRAPITTALMGEMTKNLEDEKAWILSELHKSIPFSIRSRYEAWDKLEPNNAANVDTADFVAPLMLNTGGVKSSVVHRLCADWINENVNRYSAVKRQPNNVNKKVNELFSVIFGIERQKEKGHNKPPYFFFQDINRARCQFAKDIGVSPLLEFPELDYPGMQEAVEQFAQEQAAAKNTSE